MKPGGVIIYSVCSLQPEEGPAVVDTVLSQDRRIVRDAITADAVGGESAFITPSGDLRTLPNHWPDRGGIDGFYGALLRRVE